MADRNADLVLPHNIEAEKAVLGAILIDPSRYERAAEVITASDFYRDAHQPIFRGIGEVVGTGDGLDCLTLSDNLSRAGVLDRVGGAAYLASLMDGVPRSANVEYYARIVKEQAALRRLWRHADIIARHAERGDLERAREALRVAEDEHADLVEPSARGMLTDVDVLAEAPTQDELIEGLLKRQSLVAIVGPQGAGKTTIAIGAAVAVAACADFLGRKVVINGPVVYVLQEGHAHLKARIAAAKLANGLPIDEPCGVHFWLDGLDLLDRSSLDRLIRASQSIAPVKVVIDTWASVFSGDENSAAEVGRGVRALQRIQRELGTTVEILHHTNAAATRERGSTALKAALDTMIMLNVADDALTLTCEKQRDGEPFSEIDIRLTPVPGTAAQVVRLAVDVLPSDQLNARQARALATLRGSFVAGASSAEWRATLPEIPERTFYRIQAALVRRGDVVMEGTGSRTRYQARGSHCQ